MNEIDPQERSEVAQDAETRNDGAPSETALSEALARVLELQSELDSFARQIDVRDDRIKNLALEADRRNEVMAALDAQLNQYRVEVDALRADVSLKQAQLESFARDLDQAVTQLARERERGASLELELKTLQDEISTVRLTLERSALAYEAVVTSWSWQIMWSVLTPYRAWQRWRGPTSR
jgi:chromosome segregation ATPase